MKVTSSATKTSFLNEQDGEYEEEQNSEEDIFRGADDMDESNELESEIEASNKLNIGNEHYQTVHPPPLIPTHPYPPKIMSHLPHPPKILFHTPLLTPTYPK